MLIVYVTVENKKRAKELSKLLLEKKFCACVNILPIDSLYLWPPMTSEIEQSKEVVLLIKTLEVYFDEIKNFVEKWHTYQVFLILGIKPNFINEKFENWLKKELLYKI